VHGELVEPLLFFRDEKPRVAEPPAQNVEEVLVFAEPRTHGAAERDSRAAQDRCALGNVGDEQLGGLGRRRGAHVGDPIGQRRVDLVSNGAHDWHAHGCDAPHHALVVERHQVFARAAASPDDHRL
jgi:hypothetical protein